MSYFVVKKSGNQNKSIELKTSIPPKPYMAVKHSGTVGYIPLTTETSGAGVKIKNNSKNYKVVETYTTSINSSSTYNSYYNTTSMSYYTQTTGTNYVQCDSFYIRISRVYLDYIDYDDEDQDSSLLNRISLTLRITTSNFLKIYAFGKSITKTSVSSSFPPGHESVKYDIVDIVNNQSFCKLLKGIRFDTTLYTNDTNAHLFRYIVYVTAGQPQYYGAGQYVRHIMRTGRVETASYQTQRYKRPSEQYQTYSKATSYYTVSTTSQ